jgi:tRNA threonylcarbamoyladenosine biosynthesis protein TsaB
MLILGVDTSGKNGSIALVECAPAECRTVDVVPLEGGTFSAQLVPQISEMLSKHNLAKHDIGAFAVVSGPGSFTGLRVGLAAIKALAEILNKPIVAVSRLEAVAWVSGIRGDVMAALDAGRGEIFCGEYTTGNAEGTSRGKIAPVDSEQLLSQADFFTVAAACHVVTPDQKIADLCHQKVLDVTLIDAPKADVIARLGFERVQDGRVVSPEVLDANYIRRSDAEIKTPPESYRR